LCLDVLDEPFVKNHFLKNIFWQGNVVFACSKYHIFPRSPYVRPVSIRIFGYRDVLCVLMRSKYRHIQDIKETGLSLLCQGGHNGLFLLKGNLSEKIWFLDNLSIPPTTETPEGTFYRHCTTYAEIDFFQKSDRTVFYEIYTEYHQGLLICSCY
jgi:hypothetical protein